FTSSPVRTVLASAALLTAIAPAAAQTTITLSTWATPAHALRATQVEWCDMIEKKVPGKIKCNVLPRAVAAPPGTFDAVRNGLADISFAVHGYTPSRFVPPQPAEVP